MRIVLDILRADSGRVTWMGTENTALPRSTWGYLPEERGLYPKMKVGEQLRFFSALYGVPRGRHARRSPTGSSASASPTTSIARSRSCRRATSRRSSSSPRSSTTPTVLIMDEPFTGLDPVNVRLLKEAFLEMRDRGKTLIFSTHQMETVEELCESIAIIDRGRVIVSGAVRDVKRAMGRQVVRLATDGDGHGADWLEELPGVDVTAQREDYVELRVPADRDPETILRAAIERGDRVTRFEIAEPSLEEIFIEHVGRRAVDE